MKAACPSASSIQKKKKRKVRYAEVFVRTSKAVGPLRGQNKVYRNRGGFMEFLFQKPQ